MRLNFLATSIAIPMVDPVWDRIIKDIKTKIKEINNSLEKINGSP